MNPGKGSPVRTHANLTHSTNRVRSEGAASPHRLKMISAERNYGAGEAEMLGLLGQVNID